MKRTNCNLSVMIIGVILMAFILVYPYSTLTEHESPSKPESTQENCTWPSRSKVFYREKRIINGKPPRVKWPWFVRLEHDNAGCGGALVSDRHVLTAAHCFDNINHKDDWLVYVGVVRRNKRSNPYKIKEIILHEDYDGDSIENDIALLTLSQLVQFSDNIHSVCLPSPDHIFPHGTKCWVAGFGKTNDEASYSNDLMEVSVDIIGRTKCNSQDVHNGTILQSMLCAGDLKGGRDTCNGDSGGPLVCEAQNGLWYLTGIVSWGPTKCANPNKPGVYTNVTSFLKWIHKRALKSERNL
ncbi:hypothetical protein SRHO_G00285690 [Serrasalmus rhombeus]